MLCEVHVQVYEHDALPCVQFPVEAALKSKAIAARSRRR